MTNEEIAAAAVDKIIDDLTDRRGLRHEWDNIDEDIQAEIREAWAGSIREAIRTALREGSGQ